MTFFKNENCKNDVWEKKDLLESKYEPGTYVATLSSHFKLTSSRHILHKSFRGTLQDTHMHHNERLFRSTPVTTCTYGY